MAFRNQSGLCVCRRKRVGCCLELRQRPVFSCLHAGNGWTLVVVCPDVLPFMASGARSDIAAFLEDLSRSGRILFLSIYSPGRVPELNARRIERDRVIAGISTALLAGEIRRRGNMEQILSEADARGTRIVHFRENAKPLAFLQPAGLTNQVARDQSSPMQAQNWSMLRLNSSSWPKNRVT